jgi:hypothetical protein
MKKVFFIALFVIGFFCFACSNSKVDEAKFYGMYKEILIIRETNPDTTIANPLVNELYKKNDYPKEKFMNDYLELSKDSQTFIKKIDSIRNVVSR